MQMVNEPIRISKHSQSLIDPFLVTVSHCKIIEVDLISDHVSPKVKPPSKIHHI